MHIGTSLFHLQIHQLNSTNSLLVEDKTNTVCVVSVVCVVLTSYSRTVCSWQVVRLNDADTSNL